jgi:hypothetical protein
MKMGKKGAKDLTKQEVQNILEWYSRCLSVKKTVKETGATAHQVRYHLKRNGMKPSRSGGGPLYQRIDEVRLWASQGIALSEMARRLGMTGHNHRVSLFLKKHQIPRKPFVRTGANSGAWSGGRVIDKDGYVLIKRNTHPKADRHGYVREHRLVMEALIGRHLTDEEVIHHKDDDKLNNDPSNLVLYSCNGAHLAETLKGQCPNWTPEGRAAILAAVRRPRGKQRAATPAASAPGDPKSPEMTDPKTE